MIESTLFTAKNQDKSSINSQRQLSVEGTSEHAFSSLHQRALDAAIRYRKAEAELLEALDQIDQKRVYLHYQVSSVFAYCTDVLKLSESVAYNLITVMRKSRVVPELKAKSMSGAITLSNARRVAAVITPENKQDWFARAETLSSRQLEKEIARVLPSAAVQERACYVSGSRVRLELGLSEEQMLRLRRAQDQVSQSRQRSVNLEETLGELIEFYLSKKCPVERARRVMVKRGAGGAGAELASLANESLASAGLKRAGSEDTSSERNSSMRVDSNDNGAGFTGDRPLATVALPSGTRADALARASEMKCDSRVLLEVTARAELLRDRQKEESSRAGASNRKDTGVIADRGAPLSANPFAPKNAGASSRPSFIVARANARQEREKITSSVLHAVHLRDGRRCMHEFSPGKLCGQMRFTEIHHVIPVASGGPNSVENLVTLCVAHHRARHASAVKT